MVDASSLPVGGSIRSIRRQVLAADITGLTAESGGPASRTAGESVAFIDLITPKPMMESGAGFRVVINGRSFPARTVGRGNPGGGALLTLMVAASDLDKAGAGSMMVTSGGSVWNFGPVQTR